MRYLVSGVNCNQIRGCVLISRRCCSTNGRHRVSTKLWPISCCYVATEVIIFLGSAPSLLHSFTVTKDNVYRLYTSEILHLVFCLVTNSRVCEIRNACCITSPIIGATNPINRVYIVWLLITCTAYNNRVGAGRALSVWRLTYRSSGFQIPAKAIH